jgi:hypothetical protein
MILRRTNLNTGHQLEQHVETKRMAESLVAWCGADNLAMTRAAATSAGTEAGKAFDAGEPYTLEGQYRFEIAP